MKLDKIQFKKDFLAAKLPSILQREFEVIFIWLAGSTLTGLADETSDIDLGVLIADQTSLKRNEDCLIYKPINTKVQWIYDTVADITSLQPNANQRNIGWAQLRCLSNIEDPAILYINPKYKTFVEKLLLKKDIISTYSMWLYVRDKTALINRILELGFVPSECQVKSLYHLCWASDILLDKPQERDFLQRLKHSRQMPLCSADLQKAFQKIYQLNDYFTNHIPQKPEITLEVT